MFRTPPVAVRPLVLLSVGAFVAAPAVGSADAAFERIASFPVASNLPAGSEALTETSAEIIAATPDGQRLVYSDSPLGGIGLIDIADPEAPSAAGFVALDGEPTAVVVVGDVALVALNTSASFVGPSGELVAVSLGDLAEVARCTLAGQPDSIAASPDGARLAIAIENERDEDLNGGALPQLPAGALQSVALSDGLPDCASLATIDMTGLAAYAPEDPEPEFVDINDAGEAVVSLQENNHLAIVDLAAGRVVVGIDAGAVDLDGIDAREDGALRFVQSLEGVKREPDAVHWLDGERFVTANEGDLEGGSRGFTIFSRDGTVLHDSGTDLEYRAIAAGHYPDERSGNKGVEPEGMEIATFGDETFIIVLLERASLAAVYRDTGTAPEFVQLLPTGLAPEGAVALPERGLLAIAAEADLGEDGGPRSHVSLYRLTDGAADAYPEIASISDADGAPIGWGALSGLAADADVAGRLYALSDSFYRSQPRVFTIDASGAPAMIVAALDITRDGAPAQLLDLEGITPDGEGGFWLASEGRRDRQIAHALYRIDADGEIVESIAFPDELEAVQRRFGAEGLALHDGTLWVVLQREWGDDADGSVKLLAHDLETGEWRVAAYPLDAAPDGAWVGLSDVVAHDGALHVIERDNRIGALATVKRLYRIELEGLATVALGETPPTLVKTLVCDLLPDLAAGGGYVVDKVEGLAIDASNEVFVVTDNDGTDDSNGETRFLRLGPVSELDGENTASR